jgi:hypothetical protein
MNIEKFLKPVTMDKLPKDLQKAIRVAFKETGLIDIYGNDAVMYVRAMGEAIKHGQATCERVKQLADEGLAVLDNG